MAKYEQEWCNELASAIGSAAVTEHESMRLLYVVTDTADGKVAFNLDLAGGALTAATAGKLPRGEKADVTVTIKEEALLALWAGERKRDTAFMRGDIKVEGAYERWLDELVPLFGATPWVEGWAAAAKG